MYIVLICLLLAALIAYELWKGKRIPEKAEWAVYAAVILFLIFRFPQGNDIGAYSIIFNTSVANILENAQSHMRRNVLFSELAWLCRTLFHEYRWFILVINVILYGGCTALIRKYSVNPLFSLFLLIAGGWVEVYFTSGLRQAVASVILLFAFYQFLPKKQVWRYELCVFIAIGFHEASIFAAGIPLILKLMPAFEKNPKKVILWSVLIASGVYVIIHNVLYLVIYHIYDIVGFAPSWTHTIGYMLYHNFSILGFGMEAVFGIGTLILYFKGRENLSELQVLEVLTIFMSTVLYVAFADYPIMSRVTDSIQLIMIIAIPNLVHALPDVKKKALASLAIVMLNSVLLYSDLTAKTDRISLQTGEKVTIRNYDYISLFDSDRIDRYVKCVE